MLTDPDPEPGATFQDDIRLQTPAYTATKSTLTVTQGLRALVQETQADSTLGNLERRRVTGNRPGKAIVNVGIRS